MAVLKYKNAEGKFVALTNYTVQPIVPVQTTGASATEVMSQDAVTKALGTKANATDVYTKNEVSEAFLSKSDASSTYLTQSGASNTYLTQSGAATTYATAANLNTVSGNVGSLSSSVNTISGNVGDLQTDVNKAKTDITAVSGSVNTINGNVSGLQGNLENVSGKVDTVTNNVTALTESINTTNSKINTLESTVSGITEALPSSAGENDKIVTTSSLSGYVTTQELSDAIDANYQKIVSGAPEAYDTLLEISNILSGTNDTTQALLTEVSKKANSNDVYAKTEVYNKTESDEKYAENTHTHKEYVGSITFQSKTYTSSNNTITIDSVTTDSIGAANKDHTHAISAVTGLETSLNGKANKATTLEGYGITDAYITGTTIKLGGNVINNVINETALNDKNYQTKQTTISGYGITDAKIENGTIKLGDNTITPISGITVGTNIMTVTNNVVTLPAYPVLTDVENDIKSLSKTVEAIYISGDTIYVGDSSLNVGDKLPNNLVYADDLNDYALKTELTASTVSAATKLASARTITLADGVSGSATFDGSEDITISATVDPSKHTHTTSQIDGLDDKLASYATTTSVTNTLGSYALKSEIADHITYADVKLSSEYTAVTDMPFVGSGNTVAISANSANDSLDVVINRIDTNLKNITLEVNENEEVAANALVDLNGRVSAIESAGYITTASTVSAATKLASARTITLADGVSGSATFDGSEDITISATVDPSKHTHTTSQIDGLDNKLASYALKTDLDSYATTTSVTSTLGSYALKSELDSYALKTELNSYATTTSVTDTLKSYATKTELDSYAKKTEISNHITYDDVKLSSEYTPVTDMPTVGSGTGTTDTIQANTTGSSLNTVINTIDNNIKLIVNEINENETVAAYAMTDLNDRLEVIENFYEGMNTATTYVGIPVTKRLCVVTVSAATGSFSLVKTNYPAGREVHVIIHNTASTDLTITMPTTGGYVNLSGDSLTITAGGYAEVNAISDGTQVYLRYI